jgi:RNA polymerase sigma-70 factor (ECF subfamily)
MGAARIGLARETRGADAVVNFFKGRAQGARLALVDGVAAAVWAPGGRPRVVFDFKIAGERIVEISLVADAEALGRMSVEIVDREGPAPP